MEMKRRASFGPPAAALPSRNENQSSFLPRAPLQNERQLYHPEVPSILRGLLDPHTFSIPTITPRVVPSLDPVSASHDPNLEGKLRALFPTNFGQTAMEFSKPDAASLPFKSSSLRIGVVLSGGQVRSHHFPAVCFCNTLPRHPAGTTSSVAYLMCCSLLATLTRSCWDFLTVLSGL